MARAKDPSSRGTCGLVILGLVELILIPVFHVTSYGIMLHLSKRFYDAIQATPQVLRPPYDPSIKPVAILSIAANAIGLAFIITTWITACTPLRRKKSFWIAVTFSRLVLGAVFTAAVIIKTSFMPRPLGSCEKDYQWPNDSDTPHGTDTLWKALPDHVQTSKSRNSGKTVTRYIHPCNYFIMLWNYEIVVIVALAVAAGLALWEVKYVNRTRKEHKWIYPINKRLEMLFWPSRFKYQKQEVVVL